MAITDTGTNRRIKPTLDTPFHIDYGWWARDERSLRTYLISHLPPDRQEVFATQDSEVRIDWIDPETAEVRQMDGLQIALQEAAKDPHFITGNTSLVDAVFRTFLANGNKPLSPRLLGEITKRPADMILKTIAGTKVYNGLRPWLGEDAE
jgi:hypothetical protein